MTQFTSASSLNAGTPIAKGGQWLLLTLLITSIFCTFYYPIKQVYAWHFLSFDQINLAITVQWDMLAKILTIFILVIGLFIFRYAQNYLESDSTRIRFLLQLSLVICSVLFLVCSANLLTAFIAWQFIGLNLYILLNHYHDDPAANRAAKKNLLLTALVTVAFY